MTNLSPEITVIIPVYNSAAYIENCLESIVNQSFTNFEVIIMNDNSTDSSDYLVRNFLNCNPQLSYRYLTYSKNMGWCFLRNEAVTKSNGKYICFLDADDSYNINYLKLLYSNITSKNSDFTFCGYDRYFISTNKTKIYTDSWTYPQNNNITTLRYNYIIGKTHICHCAAIYKKSFLLDNNLLYNPTCRRSGDTEFIMRILFSCKTFSFVNRSLYNYNIHAGTISTEYSSKKCLESYLTYERIRKQIKNPFWRILFTITKESRRICSLTDEFMASNEQFPELFCSRFKIICHLIINILIKRNSFSYTTLKSFCKQCIKIK